MITTVKEIDFITELTKGFERYPEQLNRLLESDAELIPLAGCDETVLAITVDSVVEEIAAGLYEDPYVIGWMTVLSSLSDLAAVGAKPLGLLVVEQIPVDTPMAVLRQMQRGVSDAARIGRTFILGGDTGTAESLHTVGVAVGLVHGPPIITRRGMQPGDFLYCSAKVGLGNAYAFSRLMGAGRECAYLPTPRIREGLLVRQYASCCIDTSDGLIPAIATLMHLNTVGVWISTDWAELMHEDAQRLATENHLPPWFFCAGPHGEFELLFSVAPNNVDALMHAAHSIDWRPIPVGAVDESGFMTFDPGLGTGTRVDPSEISDLFIASNGDPTKYLETLESFHRRMVL